MGVNIYLDILPHEITEDEWEEVYEETLQILSAYPFVDIVTDQDTYNCNWRYMTRTKERTIRFIDNEVGWHTVGDEVTLRTAESFALARNLNYYRKNTSQERNCHDILFSKTWRLGDIPNQLKDIKAASAIVFDSKTQGKPFHIPLLAIACLIESRFPYYAVVRGDVTAAQMKKAVEWANKILSKPIHLSDRLDNKKLLNRIQNKIVDESILLEMFMLVTMQKQDNKFGQFLRENFSRETIFNYFVAQFNEQEIGTVGFSMELTNYLELGFSLADACELCVLNREGCKIEPEKFIRSALLLEWPTGEKRLSDYIPLNVNDPSSDAPETVYSLFGKSILKMAGFAEQMKVTMTFSEAVKVLNEKFGEKYDVKSLVQKSHEEDDEITAAKDELFKILEQKSFHTINEISSEISDPTELITWKQGDIIHPTLEKSIHRLKEYVEKRLERDKDFFAKFQSMEKNAQMHYLIKCNKYFYIHENVWQSIYDQIDDHYITNRILSILSIVAEEKNINEFCKSLLNNQELFKEYML